MVNCNGCKMESSLISMLSDDEMLQILSFLSARELLNSRLVSRRWRVLALHPQLWRHVSTFHFSSASSDKCFWTILRLAPCLRALLIGSSWQPLNGSALAFSPLLAMETNCAAAKLCLSLGNLASLVLGALIVRRQAALGRLRHLELTLDLLSDAQNSACVHTLLQEVHAAQGLVKLALRGSGLTVPKLPKAAALDRVPVAASLKHLQFEFVNELVEEHLLPFVTEHLVTLESVQTKSNHPTLTALLASAPRLRKLGCHMLDNMMALKGCPSLKSMHLFVEFQEGEQGSCRLAEVEAYLRVATWQLTRLKLEFGKEQDQADVVDLVLSLGGPRASLRPSTLRCLALDFSPADLRVRVSYLPPLQLRPLAAVLHRLPDLRHLNLGGAPSAAFLDAIDPEVLPKLVKLQVHSPPNCTHEWFHTDAVIGVFRRNPRLHVVVECCGCDTVVDDDDSDYEPCASCAKDCCPVGFWEEDPCTAAFYSHPDAAPCGWMEIHQKDAIASQWMRVKV